jgi:hypothetical protein
LAKTSFSVAQATHVFSTNCKKQERFGTWAAEVKDSNTNIAVTSKQAKKAEDSATFSIHEGSECLCKLPNLFVLRKFRREPNGSEKGVEWGTAFPRGLLETPLSSNSYEPSQTEHRYSPFLLLNDYQILRSLSEAMNLVPQVVRTSNSCDTKEGTPGVRLTFLLPILVTGNKPYSLSLNPNCRAK